MSDYISREAFIADCEGRYCAPCKEQGKDANGVRCRACWVDDMLSEVMDAPAADVEPVRHGRWQVVYPDGTFCKGEALRTMYALLVCSECGKTFELMRMGKPGYCVCGAKMDLEKENDS